MPREEWQVVIREAHAGYISWETYEANLEQLKANSRAYAPNRLNPPREGPALLQGLVICGRCGNRMTVRYHQRGGKRIDPDYICQKAGIQQGRRPCQRILGRDLDMAVSNYLLDVITPEMVEVTLAIQDELVARAAETERLRQLQVERAQYEADLAQRRYLHVDPDNRLVASVLETEWNSKLRELEIARENAQQQKQSDEKQFSPAEQARLRQTPALFREVWSDPNLSNQKRKQILRLIMVDVTLLKDKEIQTAIRFKGGAIHKLFMPLPRPFDQARTIHPDTIAVIDQLNNDCTDSEITKRLNQQQITTLEGLPFAAIHVSALRRSHKLKSRFERLRERGWQTADEIAAKFEVTKQTVWRWYHHGLIEGARYNDSGWWLFISPEARPFRFRRLCKNK